MKRILLLFVAVAAIASASAQGISYQGEVNIGYSIGVGEKSTDRIPLHIINGIRFNPYVSMGIGVGIEYYCYYKKFMERSTYMIPLYLNVKGYLPVSKVVSPFLGVDFGYNIGVGEYSGYGGILLTPHIGVSFKVAKKSAINFSIGYAYQKVQKSTIFSSGTDNALSIRVGYQF